jgi:AcrR family transcriptional regulator
MPRKASPSHDRRPRLNRDRVLEAALAMADSSGLESLTMRRLGEALGVEAMSIYNHVDSKDAILDGILHLVLREIELPSLTEDWDVAVRRCAVSAHRVMLAHPWACTLAMIPGTGQGTRRARMRYIEALLRRFRVAGFSPELTFRAYHAVDSHILGFTLWEIGHTIGLGDVGTDLAGQLMVEVSSGDYPYLLEHADQHMADDDEHEQEGEFEFGLDIVLDGLRRLHKTEAPPRRRSRR